MTFGSRYLAAKVRNSNVMLLCPVPGKCADLVQSKHIDKGVDKSVLDVLCDKTSKSLNAL